MRSTLLAAALVLAAISPGQAATLPGDGNWAGFAVDEFARGNLGWAAEDLSAPLSFEVTIAAGQIGTLTVVDAGFSGDRFKVYDGTLLLGSTGAAVNGDSTSGAPITFDYDAALANGDFSRGSFTLGAGSHVITGVLFASTIDPDFGALNSTIGGVKLTVSAVPEPATGASLLIGLGLLLGALRRRNA